MQKKTFKYHCIVTRIMASIRLDEILLLKGKGFVRKKDNLPLNITDGDKFVTYGSVNGNFEQIVTNDICKRISKMPSGVNGYMIHGEIPFSRHSRNTIVQIDYYAYVYSPR